MLRTGFVLIALSAAVGGAKAQSLPLSSSSPNEGLKLVDCKKLRADAQSGRTLSEVEQRQLVIDCRKQAAPFDGIAPPIETYIPPKALGAGGNI